MPKPLSPAALKRLQVLYGQEARRSLDIDTSREARLRWAEQNIGRKITSFSKLTADEAKSLIDCLQHALGIAETAPSQPRSYPGKHYSQKLGTEGRKDQVHAETTMLAGDEQVFHFIQREMTALGWDDSRLKMFLRSKHGPNGGRDTMRTLGEANRVHFALKRLVEHMRGKADAA